MGNNLKIGPEDRQATQKNDQEGWKHPSIPHKNDRGNTGESSEPALAGKLKTVGIFWPTSMAPCALWKQNRGQKKRRSSDWGLEDGGEGLLLFSETTSHGNNAQSDNKICKSRCLLQATTFSGKHYHHPEINCEITNK